MSLCQEVRIDNETRYQLYTKLVKLITVSNSENIDWINPIWDYSMDKQVHVCLYNT